MLACAARTSSTRRSGVSSAARRASSERGWSAAHGGAVEERTVLQAEQQPDPASVVWGRSSTAGAGLLVDQVENDAEEFGTGVALREAEQSPAVRCAG